MATIVAVSRQFGSGGARIGQQQRDVLGQRQPVEPIGERAQQLLRPRGGDEPHPIGIERQRLRIGERPGEDQSVRHSASTCSIAAAPSG